MKKIWKPLVLFLIIIECIGCYNYYQHLYSQDEYLRYGEFQSSVSGSATDCLELDTENPVVVQRFYNRYEQMDEFFVFFYHCQETSSGELYVRLKDIYGNIYYEYSCNMEYLSNDIFCLIDHPQQKLPTDVECLFEISVEGMLEGEYIEVGTVTVPYDVHTFSSIDGVHTLFTRLKYTYIDTDAVMRGVLKYVLLLAAADVLLLIVCLLFVDKNPRMIAALQKIKQFIKGLPREILIEGSCILILGVITLCSIYYYRSELIKLEQHGFWTKTSVSEYKMVPFDSELVQPFSAEYSYLEKLIFCLDGYEDTDEEILSIEILDEEGNSYCNWQGMVSAVGKNTNWFVVFPEMNLIKGREYFIRLSLSSYDNYVRIWAVDEDGTAESVEKLRIAGEVSDMKLYMKMEYVSSFSYLVIWVIVLIVTILLTFILFYSAVAAKIFHFISIPVLLVCGYFNIEFLSGNIADISLKYVVINAILILACFLCICAVCKKRAYYITLAATLLVGIVDFFVLEFRGTDFLFSDIGSAATAATVAKGYDIRVTIEIFTCIFLTACILLLYYAAESRLKNSEKIVQEGKSFLNITKRLICVICGGAIILIIGGGISQSEQINFWDISSNFKQYGWGYTNVMLLFRESFEKPDNYTREKVYETINSIVYETEEKNVVAENIIVIMNEAFCDLEIINDLDTNKEYMPFIHSLEENTVKGNMLVSTFGGGTCITEYEVLTGNTQRFLKGGSIPYQTVCEDSEAGVCATLKEQGYYAVAIHPYEGSNWNRDNVYMAMGFDEFLEEADFEEAEYIRGFVSDKSDYDKIIESYEEHKDEDGFFVFNVTMQNHGGYDVNNGVLEEDILIENIDSDVAETYLSLIHKSDEAFEYLINYFSQVEENTMIVMFGDHMPALPDSFFDTLYGKSTSDRSLEESQKKFTVPYIIWTNYDSCFEEKEVLSANYLGSYILECAGVELTAYDKYLLTLQEEIPAIGLYGVVDAEGQFIPYDNVKDDLLEEYKNIQYMRIKDRKSVYYDIFSIVNQE